MEPICFYFGCWNDPGHYLWLPGGRKHYGAATYYGSRVHLDGTLAPRRLRRTGALCWQGQGPDSDARERIGYDSEECPQGQFLRHVLDSGFTAIQWWDRCQGDTRGACNSTILLEGEHDTPRMLEALRVNFPHVLENLTRAGIELIEVLPQDPR